MELALYCRESGKLKNEKGERNYEDSDLVKDHDRKMGIYTDIALYRTNGFKIIGFSDFNPTPVSVTIYRGVGCNRLCFGTLFNF